MSNTLTFSFSIYEVWSLTAVTTLSVKRHNSGQTGTIIFISHCRFINHTTISGLLSEELKYNRVNRFEIIEGLEIQSEFLSGIETILRIRRDPSNLR